MFREAVARDDAVVQGLYRQLHPENPVLPNASSAFDLVRGTPGMPPFVLEEDGQVVATTYLNVIPNVTRGGAPYGVIENVVDDEAMRGQGCGKQIMTATLREAWGRRLLQGHAHDGFDKPRHARLLPVLRIRAGRQDRVPGSTTPTVD